MEDGDLVAQGSDLHVHHAARDAVRRLPLPTSLAARAYADDGSAPALDVDVLLDKLDNEAHLYVCGPRGLIEAVRLGAALRGWSPARVHFESFSAAPRPGDRPVTVRLLHTGNTLTVAPGTTILDAMLAEGVWTSRQCRRGTCGQCFIPVLSGTPDHRDLCLTPEQREIGMCTCVSWATSGKIVLDL
jgi:vanillate O-demethylase ferredoxin subunit